MRAEEAVISLCDRTGNAVMPWAEAGYECWCVDVQHSIRVPRSVRVGLGVVHYVWGDARSWCPPAGIRIAFLMAFPPCTHVSGSGARDWKRKGHYLLTDALELFAACEMAGAYSGAPYFVENPVGALSSHMRKPDHTFHPYWFTGWCAADNYTKKTCLWTGNGFVMPERHQDLSLGKPDDRIHKASPNDDRGDLRSETPLGFSRAVFWANHSGRAPVQIEMIHPAMEAVDG